MKQSPPCIPYPWLHTCMSLVQKLGPCVVRPKISSAVLTSLSITGPKVLSRYVPTSRKFSLPDKFPYSWTCTPCSPQIIGFCLLVGSQNYSSKPITYRCRNQGSSHPLVTTRFNPTAPVASLYSRVRPPCGPACCAMSPFSRLWAFVAHKLLSGSSAQCWVSCVWPSHTIKGRVNRRCSDIPFLQQTFIETSWVPGTMLD